MTRYTPPVAPEPLPAPPPRRAPPRAAPRPARRGFPLGRLVTTLAILAAGAAVAIAVVTQTGGGQPEQPINEPDVPRQVQSMKDFIDRHTER
jgi:hypothetical protein